MKTPNLEVDKKIVKSAYSSSYGNSLYLTQLDSRAVTLTDPAEGPFFEHNAGKKQYELSNHLGNVLVVIADKKVSHESLSSSGEVGHYTASLLNVQDYFPGGWMLPGRKYSSSNFYRYKHQGQEGDDEIYSEGDAYFYTFRMSDSRLNRFWSVDPLSAQYPFYSTYAYSGNRLIDMVELEGAEPSTAGKQEGESGSVAVRNGQSSRDGITRYTVEYWVWHTGTCLAGTETKAGWYTQEDYRVLINGIVGRGSHDADNQWKYYTESLSISDFGFADDVSFTNNAANSFGERVVGDFSRVKEIPILGSESGGLTIANPDYVPTAASGGMNFIYPEAYLLPIPPILKLEGLFARGITALPSTALVKSGLQIGDHALIRMTERGITRKMVDVTIRRGAKFYDPLNGTINHVLVNGFASGKSLLVGTNPLTGLVTTVIRTSKSAVKSRFIPIP